MTEASTVSYDIDGAVAVVTIERLAVRNAVNRATAQALAAAFRRFDGDASASVVILTGRGGAFCAGFDLKETAAIYPRKNGAGNGRENADQGLSPGLSSQTVARSWLR